MDEGPETRKWIGDRLFERNRSRFDFGLQGLDDRLLQAMMPSAIDRCRLPFFNLLLG